MNQAEQPDSGTLNRWHVVGAIEDLRPGDVRHTGLLGTPISIALSSAGEPTCRRESANCKRPMADSTLPVLLRYGYVWTSLGTPPDDIFAIPEYAEPGRRNLNAATFGVHVSAPRVVENFLDMAHFPFVHDGFLGEEPNTEVRDYAVEIRGAPDEILATRCRFFQPRAAATSTDGAEVEYVYRVPHPFCSVLYKSSPVDPMRMDVIAIFVQPVAVEQVNAYMLLSLLDEVNDTKSIRRFQQTIFGQDKPILENQRPKRLPLDPSAETHIRADKLAIAYRRWLTAKGVTYGTITPG